MCSSPYNAGCRLVQILEVLIMQQESRERGAYTYVPYDESLRQPGYGPPTLGVAAAGEQEFMSNREERCAVVLALDTSASMSGLPIQRLDAALRKFQADLLAQPMVASKVDVGVVMFSNVVRWEDFVNATVFQPPPLEPRGGTILSFALQVALDMVAKRKDAYRLNGVSYHRPWIVLITDGYPEHDTEEAIDSMGARLRDAEDLKHCSLFTITCGDANDDHTNRFLRDRLAPPNRPPKKTDDANFDELFNWLTNSMVAVQSVLAGRTGPPARYERLGVGVMPAELLVSAATRVGRSHSLASLPNQDSFFWRRVAGGTGVVAAVSDGAGSALRGLAGSQLAVRCAVNRAARAIDHRGAAPADALWEAFVRTQEVIDLVARRRDGSSSEDYHCTLILVAWLHDAVAAVQIGDGAAVVRTPGGYKMLTVPQMGEYIHETYFITLDRASEIAFANSTDEADALVMFTDGIQHSAIDFLNKRPNSSFVDRAVSNAREEHVSLSRRAACSWDSSPFDYRTSPFSDWFAAPDVAANNRDDSTLLVVSRSRDHER